MAPYSPAQAAVLRGLAFAAAVRMAVPRDFAWRFAWKPEGVSEEEGKRACDELIASGIVREEDGRVWVGESAENERGRKAGDTIVARKWRMARAFANYAAWVPGVRGVAVCNALAWNAVEETSDIDFFILTHPGATWLVRLVATLPLMLMRLRPGEGKRDPICLSFFASTRAMNMEALVKPEGDAYMPYWVRSLVFLVDDGVAQEFRKANAWVNTLVPWMEPMPSMLSMQARRPGFFSVWLWRMGAVISVWVWMEWWANSAQENHLPEVVKQAARERPRDVVLSPDMLKLHVRDERSAIWERFQNNGKQLGV